MEEPKSLVIEVRYRDIPLSEVPHRLFNHPDWNRFRGQPVRIHVPAVRVFGVRACEGPFYTLVGKTYTVCPHIAEIGD